MLLLAFCLQLAGSIVVFVQNPEIIADLETDMKNMMTNYPLPPFEGETGESAANAKKFWDTTQKLVFTNFKIFITAAISCVYYCVA